MPKKLDCHSDDEYVVYSCDSEISSYLITVSDADCCDSTAVCDNLRCKSDSCSCSSSSCSSKCSCCSSSSSSSYTSKCCPEYEDYGHHRIFYDGIRNAPIPHTILPRATISDLSDPAMKTTLPATDNLVGVGVGDNLGNTIMSTAPADMVSPSSVQLPRRQHFRSMVTPIVDLKTPHSPLNTGGVAFRAVRMGDMVCMTSEPFAGTIAANGVSYIHVVQSIGDLPAYPINFPYTFRLNGVGKTGFIRIDRFDSSANIKFSLDQDDRNVANAGDTFETSGVMCCWLRGS